MIPWIRFISHTPAPVRYLKILPPLAVPHTPGAVAVRTSLFLVWLALLAGASAYGVPTLPTLTCPATRRRARQGTKVRCNGKLGGMCASPPLSCTTVFRRASESHICSGEGGAKTTSSVVPKERRQRAVSSMLVATVNIHDEELPIWGRGGGGVVLVLASRPCGNSVPWP